MRFALGLRGVSLSFLGTFCACVGAVTLDRLCFRLNLGVNGGRGINGARVQQVHRRGIRVVVGVGVLSGLGCRGREDLDLVGDDVELGRVLRFGHGLFKDRLVDERIIFGVVGSDVSVTLGAATEPSTRSGLRISGRALDGHAGAVFAGVRVIMGARLVRVAFAEVNGCVVVCDGVIRVLVDRIELISGDVDVAGAQARAARAEDLAGVAVEEHARVVKGLAGVLDGTLRAQQPRRKQK